MPAHEPVERSGGVDPDAIGRRLRDLAEQLAELANEFGPALAGPKPTPDVPLSFDDRLLAANARAIYRTRQRRKKYFPEHTFAEPAWDMLLELFVQAVNGTRISTTSLCLASGVPQSTGLRWITMLEQAGVLQRRRVPDDRRVFVVQLTTKGYKAMRGYLSEGILQNEMPMAAGSLISGG